tara:strand:+ start:108527 stop:109435 length:909 start_codon:yes stop_codon:yes gene_type:complete
MRNFVICLLTIAFSPLSLAGPCGFTLNANSITLPFNDLGQDVLQNISINDPNTNNTNLCKNYFVTFSKGGSGTYNNRELSHSISGALDYNLYGKTGQQKLLLDFNDVTSKNDIIEGKAKKPDGEYFFNQFPIATELRGGDYTDSILASLYSGKFNSSNALEDQVLIPIKIEVPRYIDLSIADSPTGFDETLTDRTVSFNPLNEGDSAQFYVIIKSNAGYEVTATSNNNGKLLHSGGSSFINYDFFINGSLKPLTTTQEIGTGSGLTPAGGAVYPISFEIKSVTGKLSGSYQDIININVITTE